MTCEFDTLYATKCALLAVFSASNIIISNPELMQDKLPHVLIESEINIFETS